MSPLTVSIVIRKQENFYKNFLYHTNGQYKEEIKMSYLPWEGTKLTLVWKIWPPIALLSKLTGSQWINALVLEVPVHTIKEIRKIKLS